MAGKLYGIGVGPGDPELLTLKAVRIIKESDIIAIPATDKDNCVAYKIVKEALPEIENKPILFIEMPMIMDKVKLGEYHDIGAQIIEEELLKEKNIAFLTLGDPTIYSTYLYIHKRIAKKGYETKIISGIPSFCAGAALLNEGLIENKDQLHIFPGSYDIKDFHALPGTKIIMKTGKNLSSIKQKLREEGLNASMVVNCGMEGERFYKELKDFPEEVSYYSFLVIKEESK